MFIPNTRCALYVRSAVADNFGKYTFAAPLSVPCSIVYLDVKVAKSSVRADTSGSRGQADQVQGDARILFPKTVSTIKPGDVVFKDGKWIEVIEVEPRRTAIGGIDHYQAEFRVGQAV